MCRKNGGGQSCAAVSVLRRQVQGGEGKVDAVVSATACVGEPGRRLLLRKTCGLSSDALAEHSGCAGARSVPGKIHQLSRPPHHGLKSEKKFTRGYRPRRARDKRDCDAEMPPSEEVAMVEEKRPTRAGALRALRVQVGGGL